MMRWGRVTLASMLLTCMLGFFQSSHAEGIYRFETCFQNSSLNTAGTGFAATVSNNNMTEWAGATATFKTVNNKPVCNYADPKKMADLFSNTAAGTNKFMENFPQGTTVASGGAIILSFIAPKGTTLVAGTPTFFNGANNNAPVQTKKLGNRPDIKSDPIIDITNDTGSSETLDFIGAFINNSQDPLNASINFEPDGTPVAVTASTGCGVGAIIAPNQTCEYSFDLPANTRNWAFETFADAGGLPFFDLVATTIPSPSTAVLLGAAFLVLLIEWRMRTRRA